MVCNVVILYSLKKVWNISFGILESGPELTAASGEAAQVGFDIETAFYCRSLVARRSKDDIEEVSGSMPTRESMLTSESSLTMPTREYNAKCTVLIHHDKTLLQN